MGCTSGGSSLPSISSDGRYVAFSSGATNLVSDPDTNGGLNDIFVHDRETEQTERVSENSDGISGNEDSGNPSISADGRYVAFWSYSSNLVSGDTNNRGDVFVKDIQTGNTVRVSVATDGTQGNDHSSAPAISATGKYVAFWSMADNLVSNDTNNYCDLNGDYDYSDNCDDIFVYDMQTGITVRSSVASNGMEGNGSSRELSISENGRLVAFNSFANNLVEGDTTQNLDVFVRVYFSIVAGKVIYGDGSPISDVTISAGGGNEATSNNIGEYTLEDLAPGIYSLTPPKSGYSFSPTSIEITVPPNADEVDFVGGFTISGYVIQNDQSPIPGVSILDGSVQMTTTDENGFYKIEHLAPEICHITPSKVGYGFTPSSIEVTVPPNTTNINFTGTIWSHKTFIPVLIR